MKKKLFKLIVVILIIFLIGIIFTIYKTNAKTTILQVNNKEHNEYYSDEFTINKSNIIISSDIDCSIEIFNVNDENDKLEIEDLKLNDSKIIKLDKNKTYRIKSHSNNDQIHISLNGIKKVNHYDYVIINDGKIKNEQLIDEFIDLNEDDNKTLEIHQDNDVIKVEYIKPEGNKNEENDVIDIGDGSDEDNKKYFGYYRLIINNEVKGEYSIFDHFIKRSVNENNILLNILSTSDEKNLQEICKYNIESSNYENKLSIQFNQRKDLGIKEIYNANTCLVKTFGGDVEITIDETTYSLNESFENQIISIDDILEQAKIDEEYGFCQMRYYSDGGSMEYAYKDQYTLIKLNTLNGEKDIIFGYPNSTLTGYNLRNK